MKRHDDHIKKSRSERSLRIFIAWALVFYSVTAPARDRPAAFETDPQNAAVEEALRNSPPEERSSGISGNHPVVGYDASQQQPESQWQNRNFVVSGTVCEIAKNGAKIPLARVAVVAEGQALYAITDAEGRFVINNLPPGQIVLNISMLGKVTVRRTLNVDRDIAIEVIMENDDFRIEDVTVTAVKGRAGEATSSVISRAAIDHLQATSLQDVMSLVPGGLTTNPNLNYSSQINIRTVAGAPGQESTLSGETLNMNSMGVSIVQNGAPMSNNANLQALNPAIANSGNLISSFGSAANPVGGIDTRTVSLGNVESIEVVRGIPSAQYGDVSSGMVIINTKAGFDPLRISARVNQNLYMFGAGAGYNLGERGGALNFSVDYTNNLRNPVQSYYVYERSTAHLMYSNNFFGGKWRSNTSLDIHKANNETKLNPDDDDYKRRSYGKESGITLSTNGSVWFERSWLRNISYVLNGSYTGKDSYSQSQISNANAPYSGTSVDGAVVSNTGEDIYDTDGDRVTNIPAGNTYLATYLPASYLSRYSTEGREVNAYAKLTATFVKRFGRSVDNRVLLGADFRTDGNEGAGLRFESAEAPLRSLYSTYSSFRGRNFRDIPYINQFGAFVEENLGIGLPNGGRISIQAGLRYDNVSVAGGLLAPRVNASIDIVPKILTLRGGYGVAGKMPTLIFLHPENAYFEYINATNLSYETDESKKIFVTTTRVFETQNKDLEIAKNKKAEIGFDLTVARRYRMRVTAFSERMNNGYEMRVTENTFNPVTHLTYDIEYDGGGNPQLVKGASYSTLTQYSVPTNDRVINNSGIELELDLGRFDAIRTAFTVGGAWTRTETYTKGYEVYGISMSGERDAQTNIALYSPGNTKRYYEQVVTTVRATHNIPQIGFIITLTGQILWREANWYKFENELRPVKYISYRDGLTYDFPEGDNLPPELNVLIRSLNEEDRKKEVYKPVACFNINVTKELGDYFRVSFFANNMFRHYPAELMNRKTSTGQAQYKRRNIDFMFGLELSLTIK